MTTIYRTTWSCLAVCATLIGLACAPLVMSVTGAITTFVLTAMVASAFTMSLAGVRLGWRPVRVGLAVACGVVAGLGFLVVLESAGAAFLFLLVASAPPVVERVARWSRDDTPARPAGAAGRPSHGTASQREVSAALRWSAERTLSGATWMSGPASDMDAVSLCTAWRESYRSLRQPLSSASRNQVVQRRQELLDELERRNPPEFAAWLDASRQPASQPGRYLFPPDRRDSAS